jgi:hypothetical protein
MKLFIKLLLSTILLIFCHCAYSQENDIKSTTVPIILDHNRMLVDAEIQRKDGSWRKARLWIDSGSPDFFISESLARDLGIDLSEAENSTNTISNLTIIPPSGVRIGDMNLNFEDVNSRVMFQPFWLFSTMRCDGNLPSTVLKQYHIVFDYPKRQLTIAAPNSLKPRGIPCTAIINPNTGIVQINAFIDGDSLSFALDNGASYSFISEERLKKYLEANPDLSHIIGTLGCANMWGWWPPDEQSFHVIRLPEINWGQIRLNNVGIVGVPKFSPEGPTLGTWYSKKTARPVDGFLGTNAFKAYRIEIDYANSIVYFEKDAEIDTNDMDMVGLSVRQLADSSYQIIGIAKKDNKPAVEGVESGDILISIGDFKTKGATMGTVIDALRGKPGELRSLFIERRCKQIRINAKVIHFL